MTKKKDTRSVEDIEFDDISGRVALAFQELNSALEEAHGCKIMTVGLAMHSAEGTSKKVPWKPEAPTKFHYHIGRIVETSIHPIPDMEDVRAWKEIKVAFVEEEK